MTNEKNEQPVRRVTPADFRYVPFKEQDLKELQQVIAQISPEVDAMRRRSVSIFTRLRRVITR